MDQAIPDGSQLNGLDRCGPVHDLPEFDNSLPTERHRRSLHRDSELDICSLAERDHLSNCGPCGNEGFPGANQDSSLECLVPDGFLEQDSSLKFLFSDGSRSACHELDLEQFLPMETCAAGLSETSFSALSASVSAASAVVDDVQAPGSFDTGVPGLQPLPISAVILVLSSEDMRLAGDVVNLSSRTFSENHLEALSACVKFRFSPNKVPFLQLISSMECSAKHLEQQDPSLAASFRAECSKIISNATAPRPNFTPKIRQCLKEISKMEDITVTTADKGGKMIILDSTSYSAMCVLHLEDSAYKQIHVFGDGPNQVETSQLFNDSFIHPDPSDRLLRLQCTELTEILNRLHWRKELDSMERRLLLPGQPYSGTIPKFYGLPKLHKIGQLLLRPIISCYGLYLDKVSQKLKEILNLLVWGSTTVFNAYEVVQILELFKFLPTDTLHSYDVKSLFTRVPVAETLHIVQGRLDDLRKLENDPLVLITSLSNAGIMELLNHVLSQCLFSWDNALFKQASGLPMGGRLSPVLSNIYMEHLELKVLCQSSKIPRLYLRFVDDVFLVWNTMNGSHKVFLDQLNSQHPQIQLTEECEKESSLPFLDILIKRTGEHAEIDIYRKPTHSFRYTHYDSAQPHFMKKETVRGLVLHAQQILRCFPLAYQKEIKLLKRTFTDDRNGYPPFVLDRWIRQFDRDLQRKPSLAYVPARCNVLSMFDVQGDQIFREPTATNLTARERHEVPSEPVSTGQIALGMAQMGTDGMEDGAVAERQLKWKRDIVDIEENWADSEDLLLSKQKVPVFLSPFVPGVSEDLKKISSKYELTTWYTYPGRSMDLFTRH